MLLDQDIRTHKGEVIKEYVAIVELLLTWDTGRKALLQGHFIHHESHMKQLAV
jgi:hypothetical protein